MTVRVHVDRLVLTGLGLSSAQADRLRHGLEAELVQLLGADRPALRWAAGGSVPGMRLEAPTNPADTPEGLGRQVARSLVEGIASDP